MLLHGTGSVLSCAEKMLGEAACLSKEQDCRAPPHLQQSQGRLQASGCPNSSGSVCLPIHPLVRAGADPRPRLGLTAGSRKGWQREGLPVPSPSAESQMSVPAPNPSARMPQGGDPQMGWETHRPLHYSPLVLNTLQTESHCAAEWDIALKERWEEAENILEKRIRCCQHHPPGTSSALCCPGCREMLQGSAPQSSPFSQLPRFAPWQLCP